LDTPKGNQKLSFTYEALQTWFDALQIERCRDTMVPLTEAYNRVLAEDLVAVEDLPRFDSSAVEGFAVRSDDTNGAAPSKPLLFRLTESEALQDTTHREAKRVGKGNPIPPGANAVVNKENTQKKDGKIEVLAQVTQKENIIRKGEDMKKNEVVAKTGTRLNPYNLGLLSEFGYGEVKVVDKPKIALFAYGNELAQAGKNRSDNQIFESNRAVLSAMCLELDAEPLDLGLCKKETNEIAETISLGLKIANAVISIGESSPGISDPVVEAVNKVGKPGVIVQGIAVSPAMSTTLAAIERKPLVIFSGTRLAAVTGFEVFVRPLICGLLGMKEEPRSTIKAVITKKISTELGKKNFVHVRVFQKNDEFQAEPVAVQGTSGLLTMTKTNGYVIVPENRQGLKESETVTVFMLRNAEPATAKN
jgi:molybdopterin molybdotransferase